MTSHSTHTHTRTIKINSISKTETHNSIFFGQIKFAYSVLRDNTVYYFVAKNLASIFRLYQLLIVISSSYTKILNLIENET